MLKSSVTVPSPTKSWVSGWSGALQDVATVKDVAAQAVSEFIRSPDLFQFDLFESPTITQLKGDSQYGHLYELLEIILNGNLAVSSPDDTAFLS